MISPQRNTHFIVRVLPESWETPTLTANESIIDYEVVWITQPDLAAVTREKTKMIGGCSGR